jgi:TIR domain
MAHDVFICHSSQDKAVADAACAALERADIACWIAPRNPVAGIPYGRQIIEAVENAGVVLLIFSERAKRSEHLTRELEPKTYAAA